MASQSLFEGMIPTPSNVILFSDPQIFWFSLWLRRVLNSLSLFHPLPEVPGDVNMWSLLGILLYTVQFSSVQSLSHVRLLVTPWIAAPQAFLSITNSRGLLTSHVHWVCDAIQPSHPLSSPFPPTHNPSQHQSLLQSVNSSHEVAKVLEFQL